MTLEQEIRELRRAARELWDATGIERLLERFVSALNRRLS